MAVAQYYAWDRAGRPLNPAQPIREFVDRLKVAFPRAAAAAQFSWYADNAHYQADYPEDHTPYSYTGWPLVNPYPYVFATDVMHRPDLGVDCNALFAYWIGEARAGWMPWLKYLIWQARVYSVRTGWSPVLNSGHHDHIHLSARTDHLNTGLGAWSVVPGAPPTARRLDMPGLFKLADNATLYMSDGFKRKTLTGAMWADFRETWGNVPVAVVADMAALEAIAGPDWTTAAGAPVEVELSDEQLAALAAQLAELQPDPLTYEQTVAAAEEGAEAASDR